MSKQQELDQAEARLSELESQYAHADEEQQKEIEPQIASQQQTVDALQQEVAIEQQEPSEAFLIYEDETFSFETEAPKNEFTAEIERDLELYEIQQRANEQEVQPREVTMDPETTLSSYITVDDFDNPIEVYIEVPIAVPNRNYPVHDQTQHNEPVEDVSEPEYSMQDFLNENGIPVAKEQEIPPPPPPQPEVEEPQA